MNLLSTYKTCYKKAVAAIETIDSPYEKAKICTDIMNSIATLIASGMISSSEEDAASPSNKAAKSKKTTVKDNEADAAPIIDVNTTSNNDIITETAEVDTNLDNNMIEDNSTKVHESIIDKTEETDTNEWTDEMLAKYATELEYAKQVKEFYGDEALNEFISNNTNGLYNSLDELDPFAFAAIYPLLVQATASDEEEN